MKRYALFAYDCYYPCGGMNDFKASFDTLEKATAAAWTKIPSDDYRPVYEYDIVIIWDTTTNEEIWSKP